MSYILNKIRMTAVAYLRDHAFTFITITGIDAYLDQFMVLERNVNFVEDGIRETGISGHYYRFQMVRPRFQKSFLVIGNHE